MNTDSFRDLKPKLEAEGNDTSSGTVTAANVGKNNVVTEPTFVFDFENDSPQVQEPKYKITKVEAKTPWKLEVFFELLSLQPQDKPTEFKVSINKIDPKTETNLSEKPRIKICSGESLFTDFPIEGNGTYSLRLSAVFADGTQGDWGEEWIEKVAFSQEEILTHTLLQSSVKISSERSPELRELQMDQTFCDKAKQVRKMELGEPPYDVPVNEKVIMIVGETGCGKTTLINAMVNYIFKVKFEENFRFQIVTDSGEQGLKKSQAESQTQWVTSYTFHPIAGTQNNDSEKFAFTLIDTPGFGDTGGIQRDKEIVDRIKAFFSCKGGIDHIDAVGFVVKASSARLTQTEQYVFDSILSLFGNNIGDNFFILVTFADANQPPVKHTLDKAGIKYNKLIKFNNSAIFSPTDSDDPMAADFNKLFWNMGMSSFKGFFDHLWQMKPKSLSLTKDVLQKREQLQVHVTHITQKIRDGLGKLEALESEIGAIKEHEADIERNKDFTYEVDEQKSVQIYLEPKKYVTNCPHCHTTCHYPCAIPNDEDKAGCAAMTNGYCTVCKEKCHWKKHFNMPYRWEIQVSRVTKTSDDLKKKHQVAQGKAVTAKEMAQGTYEEYLESKVEVMELVENSKQCLNELRNIALKPDPLSQLDYIDKLIAAEEQNAKEGWQQRVKQLNEIRNSAQRMVEVQTGDVLTDLVENEERVSKKYEGILDKKKAVTGLTERVNKVSGWYKQLTGPWQTQGKQSKEQPQQ